MDYKVFEDLWESLLYGILIIELLSVYWEVNVIISTISLILWWGGWGLNASDGELWSKACPTALQGEKAYIIYTSDETKNSIKKGEGVRIVRSGSAGNRTGRGKYWQCAL